MASYDAVEVNWSLYENRPIEVTSFNPDIPRSKPVYNFDAVEVQYFPGTNTPRYVMPIVNEYVWVGPGGSFDAENSYWG